MSESKPLQGPDFASGVPVADLSEGQPLLGHAGKDAVILVRKGEHFFAVGASCTHYHGPLAKGLVVDETVRCPWHHACFSLRNGEVLNAPGLNPLPCWNTEQRGGTVFVRDKLPLTGRSVRSIAETAKTPDSIVIVGGGAAGNAAAETLRFCGYRGPVTLVSGEDSLPPDRPNLSKDYLAGTAPEAWVPIRAEKFYAEQDITLLRNTRVAEVDIGNRRVRTAEGGQLEYGSLLLATGAEPVRPPIPGAQLPHVHYLRSVSDSRGIIAAIEKGARRFVVIGASFIGLEVAASLRARNVEVHVVAPEPVPMERVFGARLGKFIANLHESRGVVLHLGQGVAGIDEIGVTLADGSRLSADAVVMGVGVRPALTLAEQMGLKLDRGVSVNAYLETSAPGVYAAGDIARWPDPVSGSAIRVEHWAVAQQQGRIAARNMLGLRTAYRNVPFFWSQHYDVTLNYVGHAERWDRIEEAGDPEKFDCAFSYMLGGRRLAVASIFRDRYSLEVEVEMERVATGV
ncbi:MAG TPA: FAD-dependent oxidoreductase [Gammaproteobacteria bacterium]|nr:FAD-dependent oxidoreductase [Gammaproteobacteria bacterium]